MDEVIMMTNIELIFNFLEKFLLIYTDNVHLY